jgi:hypothetical protein
MLAAQAGMPRGIYFNEDTEQGGEEQQTTEDINNEEQTGGEETSELTPQGDGTTEFVYNGQTFSLSKKDVNQLLHMGIDTYLSSQSDESTREEPPQEESTQGEESSSGEISSLRNEIKELREFISTTFRDQDTKNKSAEITREMNDALNGHILTKKNKKLRATISKAVFTELSRNPNADISEAVKAELEGVTGIDQEDYERYLRQKADDRRKTKTGGKGGSPGIEAVRLSGEDILNGTGKTTLMRAHRERQRVNSLFNN